MPISEPRAYLLAALAGISLAVVLVVTAANTAGGWSAWPLGGPPSPSCNSGGPQPVGGTALAVGTAAEAAKGGNYWYNFTIESTGSGLSWSDLHLEVANPSGIIIEGLVGYVVLNVNGSPVLRSSGAIETSWTSVTAPATLLISSTQTISLQTTVNLASTGATLDLIAAQPNPNPCAFGWTNHANIP